MINGSMEQFLDTGWYSEATLYFNGYIFWCEATTDSLTHEVCFIVEKWKARNENNLNFHSLLTRTGELEIERVLEIHGHDLQAIKQDFLSSKIFDGHSFWEIEKCIAWLDEGTPETEQQ